LRIVNWPTATKTRSGSPTGKYVAAHLLTDERGGRAGYIFGYQGSSSWNFCVISGRSKTTYDVEVSSEGGRTWELGEIYVHESEATWGRSLPIPLHDVKRSGSWPDPGMRRWSRNGRTIE